MPNKIELDKVANKMVSALMLSGSSFGMELPVEHLNKKILDGIANSMVDAIFITLNQFKNGKAP